MRDHAPILPAHAANVNATMEKKLHLTYTLGRSARNEDGDVLFRTGETLPMSRLAAAFLFAIGTAVAAPAAPILASADMRPGLSLDGVWQ